MKRILLALCLCLALALGLFVVRARVGAAAEEPAWIEAYEQVLNERAADGHEDADIRPELSYLVYDIDKDGAPELVVKSGTCEADFSGTIYSFRDGQLLQIGEAFHLGHGSLYSDPGENGVILMYGHMGYASALRLSLTEDGCAEELLYEDDLNVRLQDDPDADYIYPGDVIPGSVYLTMCRWNVTLPLTHYEEIGRCLEGALPEAGQSEYPNRDESFFDSLMANNGEVFAVTADGYTNSPGQIGFRDLLRQNAAAEWMQGDLSVLSAVPADLNGDGKLECVVAASDGSSEMRIVLSEQDGAVYAYMINYTDRYELDAYGNFLHPYFEDSCYRLIFDGQEAFLLILPKP